MQFSQAKIRSHPKTLFMKTPVLTPAKNIDIVQSRSL